MADSHRPTCCNEEGLSCHAEDGLSAYVKSGARFVTGWNIVGGRYWVWTIRFGKLELFCKGWYTTGAWLVETIVWQRLWAKLIEQYGEEKVKLVGVHKEAIMVLGEKAAQGIITAMAVQIQLEEAKQIVGPDGEYLFQKVVRDGDGKVVGLEPL